MQWKIILLLLGYVAANTRFHIYAQFNPNHEQQHRENVELVRQQAQLLRDQIQQQLELQPLQCATCKFYDKYDNQYVYANGMYILVRRGSKLSTPIPPLTLQAEVQEVEHVGPEQTPQSGKFGNTQGGNGATGGNAGNGATTATLNRGGAAAGESRGTSTASNRVTPPATNRVSPAGEAKGTTAAGNRETHTNGNRGRPATDKTATYPINIPQSDNAQYKFHQKLFKEVAPVNAQRNVIYSPMSLNTLLAMVYIGAKDNTAQEMQRTLELPTNRDQCAKEFQRILATDHVAGDAQLLMANKMYYNKALVINPAVNNYAQDYFKAEVEPINFSKTSAAVENINNWVAGKTQQRIQNLISPYSLDARTSAILINAVYFKAKWAKEFSTSDTQQNDFYVSPDYKVLADMMYTDDIFTYGELEDLQASALELPFKDTDLSMLIVLPNEKNGLRAVEEKLSHMDLSALVARMKPESVTVRLPKFSIEYEQDMVQPLIKTGINDLFTPQANLTGFFEGPDQPLVSKVQHKAFINVNEAGVEAAAASFAKFIPLSLPAKPFYFTADHPFMFVIRSPQAVYFAGHVVNI